MKSKRKKALLVLIVILFIYSLLPLIEYSSVQNYDFESHYAESIDKDSVIEQEFIPKTNAKEGISVTIGTYMKVLSSGNMLVEIYDQSNEKKIYKKNLTFASITDSAPLYFNCNLKKNNKYLLKITLNNVSEDNMIAFRVQDIKNSNLRINGENKNYDFDISLLNYSIYFSNIWIASIAVLLYLYKFKLLKGCEKDEI